MNHTDILVVGAGITGLATTCQLAMEGFQVTLVDAGPIPGQNKSAIPERVIAVNLASKQLIEHIGVWSQLGRGFVTPYTGMDVWDENSSASIQFDARDYGEPYLGYIVSNLELTQGMLARLKQNYNVRLAYNTSLKALEPGALKTTVHFDGGLDSLTADLVIAADGRNSSVRKLAGIAQFAEDFQQDAIVATLQSDRDHCDTAYQCFTQEGPIALLPVGHKLVSLVWSCQRDSATDLLNVNDDDFCAMLEARFASRLGKLALQNQRRKFSLHSQHADHYQGPGLALLGDAAHSIHPLAGLGANLGLMDSAALIQTMLSAKNQGKSFSSTACLRKYERWRRGDNATALHAMRLFNGAFQSQDSVAVALRQSGFHFANNLSQLKAPLATYAMGRTGDLPEVCKSQYSA